MLAPIVLFVYSRYEHTVKVIEALSKNKEAKDSMIYIFSDAAKNERAEKGVNEVREYIHKIKDKGIFKEVIIKEAEKNKGLAKSVISGVTEVINKHGKVIVIEDDAVSSGDFLEYMNSALDYFEDNEKIWGIGGYTPNIKIPEDYNHDIFIHSRNSSYAWATWQDRWNRVDWKVSDYGNFKFNIIKRHKFNKYGQDRSTMLDAQMHGKIDSWAIRYSYALVFNNMYVVLPIHSRIKCIGNDGSGTHCGDSHTFDVDLVDYGHSIKMEDVIFDKRISKEHAKFFKSSLWSRFKRYIKIVVLKR